MTVLFHPEFPKDVWRFAGEYSRVSHALAERFRREVMEAIEAIKLSPAGAGHLVRIHSSIIEQLRRKNLRSFPFFLLYSFGDRRLIFGSVIPSRSDPLTWLNRFE